MPLLQGGFSLAPSSLGGVYWYVLAGAEREREKTGIAISGESADSYAYVGREFVGLGRRGKTT